MSEMDYHLNIDQVRKFLPHRHPFLLIDRVLEILPSCSVNDMSFNQTKVGTKAIAIKNITFNEPIFAGHFPNYSIFPGVMVIETMAQAASFCIYPYVAHDLENMSKTFQCILVGVNEARFRKPVIPGDTLRIEAEVTKCRGKIWGFHCRAMVDGQLVAEAEILAHMTASISPMGNDTGETS